MSITNPDIFRIMHDAQCEELVFKYDERTDLRFILIKHSTFMNSKVNGGIRMAGYTNVAAALADGIGLAEAMTLKNILYQLPWGGGKAVIIGYPKKTKRFLHTIGDFVQSFNGEFQTTIDMGFTERDAVTIAEKTQYIDSLPPSVRSGCLGSSAVGTGIGIVAGMRVAAEQAFDSPSLTNKTIVVLGLGRVGSTVVKELVQEGAHVIGADIDSLVARRAAHQYGIKIVSPLSAIGYSCDVFSPCAHGGILNAKTLSKLRCRIIAGGANNQLEQGSIGDRLDQKGILYIPDFVLNGGGMLQSQCEYDGKTLQQAHDEVRRRVSEMVTQVLTHAKQKRISPDQAAKQIVEKTMREIRSSRRES